MNILADIILASLVILNLRLAGSSRLGTLIKAVALQGFFIGLLPLIFTGGEHWGITLINITVKGVLMPVMLTYAMKKTNTKRELEPLVGMGKSVAIIFAITLLSFYFCEARHIEAEIATRLAVPLAFTTIATGLFLIISRRKAITQVIGFLVFENGVSIFGASIAMEYGLLIELGILLDVFVLVFILGIAIYDISRTFSSIDIDKLNHLGDRGHIHFRKH